MYHDPRFTGFSSLRVLNEDRVSGGQGFGAHPHSNYEIFSYVIAGGLKHKDTMSNQEVIKRGGVQFTSAGSGIMHSEYNDSRTEPVHFLQVWLKPDQRGLKPSYQTAEFTDEEKHGKLCLIVTSKYHQKAAADQNAESLNEKKDNAAPVVVNQNAQVYASLLAKDEAVTYSYDKERCGYLHLCQSGGRLRLRLLDGRADGGDDDEIVLEGGDGVFIQAGTSLQLVGANVEDDKRAEFLLFDLAKENGSTW
jgi:redox-sensitive bicupin YhaK (pirin superfamily)